MYCSLPIHIMFPLLSYKNGVLFWTACANHNYYYFSTSFVTTTATLLKLLPKRQIYQCPHSLPVLCFSSKNFIGVHHWLVYILAEIILQFYGQRWAVVEETMEPRKPNSLLSGSLRNMFVDSSSKKIITAVSFGFLFFLPPVRIIWPVFPSSPFQLGCIQLFIDGIGLRSAILLPPLFFHPPFYNLDSC